MKRNYFFGLLAALLLVPFSSVKAQYDAGDSTALYNMMTNNFGTSNLLNWNDPNPGNWLSVVWDNSVPKRVIQLDLDDQAGGTAGNTQGTSWSVDMSVLVPKYESFSGATVDTRLIGELDFSGLSALKYLDLRSQDSITKINIQGLNNLEVMYMVRTMVDSVDASNLPNLIDLKVHNNNNLVYIDASNCPRLKWIKGSRGEDMVDEINISGSDSLILLCVKDPRNLTDVNLTGKTELRKLGVNEGQTLATFTGVSSCSKLVAYSAAQNNLSSGIIDLADFDTTNMYKFNIRSNGGDNRIDSVANWMTLNDQTTDVVGVAGNRLSLNNAAQIFNELVSNTPGNYYGTDQVKWGGDTIYVGGQKDYSSQASIDINGTPVASSFQLYDATSTPVGGANATGIFTFPTINDTGEYYVEMTNPGANPNLNATLLTTNNFWVLECPTIDTSTSAVMTTITSNEGMAGATYRWLDCDNGMAVIAGETGQNFTATVNGNYAVEITLGAPCNNVDTSACVSITSVGIEEMADFKSVAVYPNPIQDQVTIEMLEDYNNVTVMIMNLEGKMVYNNTNVRNNKLTIRTADWKQGIYMVKVFSDEFTNTYKLIK